MLAPNPVQPVLDSEYRLLATEDLVDVVEYLTSWRLMKRRSRNMRVTARIIIPNFLRIRCDSQSSEHYPLRRL